MEGKYFVHESSYIDSDVESYSLVPGVLPTKHVEWVCECSQELDTDFYCKTCEKQYPLQARRIARGDRINRCLMQGIGYTA